MKRLISILTFFCLSLNMQNGQSQTKTESLGWLRSHLDTIVVYNDDSILPYTMTKTYTFYDDAFVVKTVKDFYKDPSLNGAPAFSKIRYIDIIPEKDIVLQEEHPQRVNIFTITANPVYYIIGKEEAPLSFWRHFDEPSGLDLYLPEDKVLSTEAVKRLMLLAETKEPIATAYPNNIQKDYKLLVATINRQKFPLPPYKGRYIRAELNSPDRITIVESRPKKVQE